jgi:phosphoglycolate phosphatase
MKSPIFLFDIDGTLLSAKGSGRKAFDRACELCFDLKDAVKTFSFAGATDLAVLNDLSQIHNLSLSDKIIDQFKQTYARLLEEECSLQKPTPISGSIDFIKILQREFKQISLGLITGNFKATAHIKLKHAGFGQLLMEGGFGDDHPHRSEIARIARQRLSKHPSTHNTPVILFGDTEKDFEAALTNDYFFVGMDTGFVSKEEFHSMGAQCVVQDYLAPDQLLSQIRSWMS